jgi:hypothetical protein
VAHRRIGTYPLQGTMVHALQGCIWLRYRAFGGMHCGTVDYGIQGIQSMVLQG